MERLLTHFTLAWLLYLVVAATDLFGGRKLVVSLPFHSNCTASELHAPRPGSSMAGPAPMKAGS